jgi:hypothetical protein
VERGKTNTIRTLYALFEGFMFLVLSPQDCSGVYTNTRNYGCRVTALRSFYDLVFVSALVFNALFLGGEVLVLEEEFLVHATFTRSIRLTKEDKVWLL